MVLEELARHVGFRSGLVAGTVALVVVAGASLATGRHSRHRPLGLAGVAVVLAVLVALPRVPAAVSAPGGLFAGLVVLAAGALVTRALPAGRLIGVIAALPGAAIVVSTRDIAAIDIPWVRALAFVTIAVGAALVADFDRENARAGLAPVLLAVTALGIYTTVPDTEQATVLVGATLPLALLGWPKPLASLGEPGAAAVVGLVVWISAVGGQARPGAIVGAMACLGVMLVEPLVRRAFRRNRAPAPSGPLSAEVVLIAALHVAVVLFVSLAAGREISARGAVALSAVAFATAAVALAAIFALRRPQSAVTGRT